MRKASARLEPAREEDGMESNASIRNTRKDLQSQMIWSHTSPSHQCRVPTSRSFREMRDPRTLKSVPRNDSDLPKTAVVTRHLWLGEKSLAAECAIGGVVVSCARETKPNDKNGKSSMRLPV